MQFKIGDKVEIVNNLLRQHAGETGVIVKFNHLIPWPIIIRADNSKDFCCKSDEIRKVEQ